MSSNKYTMKARRAILDSLKRAKVDAHSPIGVGVSGGADSSSLMLALSTIYHGAKAKLIHVLIVNHQLQEVTDQVSEDVARTAESLGFNAHILPVSVEVTANGAESDAREARYAAFEELRERFDLRAILLGHTKSDQAEQVMLGLLRGSGTRSLSGIREQRDVYFRPLLNRLTRKETQRVCEENDYEYWNDPHNELDDYRRVVIRKLISGVERETGQSLIEPLVRTAKLASEDADALDYFASLEFEKQETAGWLVSELSVLPVALRKRLYKKKIEAVLGSNLVLTMKHLEAVDALITDWRGQKQIDLPHFMKASRVAGHLIFAV